VVLKFAGVDSISDAERLAGCEVQVPSEDRSELEVGAAYVSEIVGCEVWVDGGRHRLGRVSEVQFGGGEAPLLVVQLPAMALPVAGREKEVLVPFAEEFVKKFDPAERRIEMQLPEGLLDLDAPLSAEEKQRQKKEADEARAAGEGRSKR
jgi:16S rRNA processing protein RimM